MRAAAALGLIQRVARYETPAQAITAPLPAFAGQVSPAKGLSDNRTRYFAQSALTGIPMRDSGPAPLLPVHQAADVVRWARGAPPPH